MDFEMEDQHEVSGSKARKRARTAVACRRCKVRKQKCDGASPSCSNCTNSDSTCEYDFSLSLNRNQEQYLRARRRVEELEDALGRLPQTSHEPIRNISPALTSSPPPQETLDHPPQSVTGSPFEPSRTFQNLAFQATGSFVGSPSADTFGRVLHAVISSKSSLLDQSAPSGLLNQKLTPKSLESAFQPSSPDNITLAGIPDVIADRMISKGYLHHIAILWPVIQPSELQRLHRNRAQLTDRFDIAAIHLVYAAAGRFLETTGETGSFRSEQHYRSAMALLGEILALSASIQTVQILLLLAIYGLRAPRGPGAWPLVGIAMRMCIELGMHRKGAKVPGGDVGVTDQLRCIFWSCYCLDRQTSIILGRPFAVADQDIDAELPEGIDEESRRSLVPFTHICRLRRIESRIQQTIYRVDKAIDSATMTAEIEGHLRQLEAWKSTIPTEENQGTSSLHTRDSYVRYFPQTYPYDMKLLTSIQLIYYHQAMRILLQTHLLTGTAEDRYLLLAVQSCGGICQTYKRLHQSVSVGYSLMALHSVFFAGIMILYCAWDSPTLVLTNATRNMINDCSIVLYIITERWPGAKRLVLLPSMNCLNRGFALRNNISESFTDFCKQSTNAEKISHSGIETFSKPSKSHSWTQLSKAKEHDDRLC